MVLFCPIQQELNCISGEGHILGKIKYDGSKDEYFFAPESDAIVLSDVEGASIAVRLSGLASGKYLIPMQDDD